MVIGASHGIRFRDINSIGLSNEEEFRITYSVVDLTDNRFVYGQGFSNTKSGGTHLLQGRVIGFSRLQTVNGTTHSLQGRVIVE